MVDVLAAFVGRKPETPRRSFDLLEWFGFNGQSYAAFPFTQTLLGDKEEIGNGFQAYVEGALKKNGIIYALEAFRVRVLSDTKFVYRNVRSGTPRDYFTTSSLNPLTPARPLIARAVLDVDLAGNHFAWRDGLKVRRLRPDWVTIIMGGDFDMDAVIDPTADVVGYLYHPGGLQSGNEPITFTENMVAHWAPMPDPTSPNKGMSWLTPVLREISADSQAVEHKKRFYDNGATPNMVVTLPESLNPDVFKQWIELFNENHQGAANAYKTLFLGAGAEVKPVGANFQQIDYRATQAYGETRLANAAGIHPSVLGLSDSLQGSSLNAGNYTATRRSTADAAFRPYWGSLVESYSKLVTVPRGAELWYDDRQIEFLQEDRKDNAEIQQIRSQSIRQLIDAGYEPDSIVQAIVNDDLTLLRHSGLFSVQLQEAGEQQPDPQPEPDDEQDEDNE